jgi:hypothetical protein
MKAVGTSWTCPTCRATVLSPFCPQCGERPLRPIDLSVRNLLAKLVHALTSIDGKFLRTCRVLLKSPGELTNAYLSGARQPYIAPFQLFLIANVLFFAVQSATAINIFGANLASHLHEQDWSALAQTLVARHLAHAGIGLDAYAEAFDRAVVVNAKSLVILMVVPFSLLLALVHVGSRKPLITHTVFSLHVYTFLLLLFSLAVVIVAVSVRLGGPGLASPQMDNILSVVNLAACGAYTYVAMGTVFGGRAGMRWIQVIVLTLAAGAFVVGYRFVVFLITIYVT